MLAVLALILFQSSSAMREVTCLTESELVARLPCSTEEELLWNSATQSMEYVPALVELRSRIAAGKTLDLDCWRTILANKGYLRWRTRWPIGSKFALSLRLPALQDRLAIELVPRQVGWKPASTAIDSGGWSCGIHSGDSPGYQELGWLAREQREVIFDVHVDYAPASLARKAAQGTRCVGAIRVVVEPVPTLDDAIVPIKDALWGERIAGALRLEDPGLSACLFVGEHEWPETLACALDVSLLYDGRTVEARELWIHGARGHEAFDLLQLPRAIVRKEMSADGWSLRLRGTPKRILGNWNATQYWSGEIEIPLAQLLKR